MSVVINPEIIPEIKNIIIPKINKPSIVAFVTSCGFIINDKYLRARLGNNYDKVIKTLQIEFLDNKFTKKYNNYKYSVDASNNTIIYLPRNILSMLYKLNVVSLNQNIINKIPAGTQITNITHIPQPNLHEYQHIAINYLTNKVFTQDNIAHGIASTVVEIGAGLGKTFIAAGLIHKLGAKTLFITPTIYLAEQAINDFKSAYNCTNIEKTKTVKIKTKVKNKTNSADTISTVTPILNYPKIIRLTSANLDEEHDIGVIVGLTALNAPQTFFEKYKLIIIDEIQMFCGAKIANIFWKTYNNCVLGMTATASHRSDGFDIIYKQHLNGLIKSADIPNFNSSKISWKSSAEIVDYYGPKEYTGIVFDDFGNVSPYKMKMKIINDPYRLRLVTNKILELMEDPANNIFVFAEYKDYLKKIKTKLLESKIKNNTNNTNNISPEKKCYDISPDEIFCDFNENTPDEPDDTPEDFTDDAPEDTLDDTPEDIPEIDPQILSGDTARADIEQVKQSRLILTTYAYSNMGVSIVKMNCIIIVTPRKSSFIQILGRIFRRGGDITIPRKIIIIHDKKNPYKKHLEKQLIALDVYEIPYSTIISSYEKIQI